MKKQFISILGDFVLVIALTCFSAAIIQVSYAQSSQDNERLMNAKTIKANL
jgi:hypothetical protein